MQTIDSQTNDRCVGCGEFAAFCESAVCADTLQAHSDGDHSGCDMLVCDEASLSGLDPFKAESPLNTVYIPTHKLGVVHDA